MGNRDVIFSCFSVAGYTEQRSICSVGIEMKLDRIFQNLSYQ